MQKCSLFFAGFFRISRILLIPVLAASIISCGKDQGGSQDEEQEESSYIVKVGILGDSISTFEEWIPSGYDYYYPKWSGGKVTAVKETWWYRLIYTLMPSAKIDKNLSYSGTLVTKTGSGTKIDQNDFISRVETEGFNNPDIIVIHGGTNDRYQISKNDGFLGEYDWDTPLSDLDRYSFRPSYIYLVRKLMADYPGVKIVCIAGDCLYKDDGKYIAVAESIEEIAGHYGCLFVGFKTELSTIDGIHPDEAGMVTMAYRVHLALQAAGLLHYDRSAASAE